TLLPALGLLAPRLLRVHRKHLRYLILYGLMLAIFNALWTLSVALNGAAVSTVLVYCSTGFTTLLGWWLLKERLDWGKLVAIVLSLGGCVLVSGALDAAAWQANLAGIVTGILSGLLYAIYSLMGRSAAQRGLNPWTTLLYTFGFAAMFLLLFNLLPGGPVPGSATSPADFFWLGDALAGWGVLFLLAAGPTVLGFGLYNVSLGYLPSSVANLIVTLEPAFTAVSAYLLFGERLNGIQLAGSLIILAGVVIVRHSSQSGQPHQQLIDAEMAGDKAKGADERAQHANRAAGGDLEDAHDVDHKNAEQRRNHQQHEQQCGRHVHGHGPR
ncbi:MAG: DMT family transporter, partial [Chloroflexi bacterium]|nr:DMT family transporter [Chloroflexota bacterium]